MPESRDETPEAILQGLLRQKARFERYRGYFTWTTLLVSAVVSIALGAFFGSTENETILGAIFGGSAGIGTWLYFRFLIGAFLKGLSRQLALSGAGSLQETLEEDFFTKLVKINFKYLDPELCADSA